MRENTLGYLAQDPFPDLKVDDNPVTVFPALYGRLHRWLGQNQN